MATRESVEQLINTNLADYSDIHPEEHREVLDELLDYIDGGQQPDQEFNTKIGTVIWKRIGDYSVLVKITIPENSILAGIGSARVKIGLIQKEPNSNSNARLTITETQINIGPSYSLSVNLFSPINYPIGSINVFIEPLSSSNTEIQNYNFKI